MSTETTDQVIAAAIDKAIAKYSDQNKHPAICPFHSEDIAFIRTWRKRLEQAANGIGMFILLSVLGGIMAMITLGLNVWKGSTP